MLQHNGHMTVHQSSRVSRDKAADLARRLVKANQDYNTLQQEHGAADYIRNNLLNELLTRTESIIDEDIPQASSLNLAGRIAYDLTLQDLAKDYFARAHNLEPSKANYLLNLANAEATLGDYQQAEIHFNRVLKLDAKNLSAFIGIAYCLLQTAQYDKAFLHYRSIISFGHTDAAIHDQVIECIENLHCDRYTLELELFVLYLLALDDADTSRLVRFSGELLAHKYGLKNPDCILDMSQLEQDALLIAILETGVVAEPYFEELVTQLRLSILTEAVLGETVREELLPLAMAIGCYASHTDYALVLNQEEEREVNLLKQRIAQQIGYQKVVIEDTAGALIILAMYEALYVQSFSFDLLAFELAEWPLGMQNLLKASLYDLSDEHQARYELFGQTMTELLDNGITRSSNRWKPIPAPHKASFYQTIKKQIAPQTPPRSWHRRTVRVLMLACGSGQKPYQYATQFHSVTVMAADANQVDMAYAHAQVKKGQLDNLNYAVADYSHAPNDIEPFDYIEFGEGFDFSQLEQWMTLLADDGIARIILPGVAGRELTGVLSDLVKARGMHPSLENIRLIRNSILLERSSQLWERLFENPQFYSGSGCRDLIFNNKLAFFNLEKSYRLLNQAGLISVKEPKLEETNDHSINRIDLFTTKA